jgi:hypothetical protein
MSNIDRYVGNQSWHKSSMEQPAAHAPFSCRLKEPAGDCLPGEEFCGFEFPWCEGCPKSVARKARALEDPMKAYVWQGWINGISVIKK